MTPLTKEEAEAAVRQAAVTEAPETNAFAGWPLHKVLAAIYKDCGPESVVALLAQFSLRYEELTDNALELERRHFGHVGKLLRDAAKSAKSEIDDILEQAPDYIARLGADAVESDKRRRLTNWMVQRMKSSGQSWNSLIHHYGIEEWVALKESDYRLDAENRVHHVPAANGAGSGQ